MPQASDEDREKMAKYFGGDGISDAEPMQYLHGKGLEIHAGRHDREALA